MSGAVIAHWQPKRTLSLTAFTGHIDFKADASPFLFTAGDFLPPRTKRGLFYGQRWADQHYKSGNSGMIGAAALGAHTELRAGIFRSVLESPSSFADIFLDVVPERSANHVIVANAPQEFASTSGEVRLSHTISEGRRQHVLRLVARGRSQHRRYGGEDVIDYGGARIGVADPRPEPQFQFGAQSRDSLRQTMFGIAYGMRWGAAGELSAGVQRTRFSKAIVNPGQSPLSKASSAILYNVGGTVRLAKSVSAYAGFTRGLEEGGVAPNVATNRNQAFAPIVTRQADGGLKVELRSGLKLVAGAFTISKPYFGLDADSRYGELGSISNKGVEISIAGEVSSGLSVVAGAVLTRPRLSGEAVRTGLIAPNPLGSRRRELIVSADYAMAPIKGLSVDATVRSVGRQVATVNGRVRIPAYSTIGLGMRYRWSIGGDVVVARIALDNALDKWSWTTDSSGIFYPLPQRAASLTLTADLK
jgi:iron complex outermembrane receptor protein